MHPRQEIWECPQCGTQLNVASLGFCAEVVCPQCGTRALLHTLLANFKLDGVLGVGGMSEVFRAHDMVLGRPVAIKVLNSTYRDEPERINRFEGECSLMAKVRHENVVSVYSAGWARGQFYIAMEVVEGRNLETMVAEQKFLLPPQALEMTRQTAEGLRAAQQVGILHRDVKPGNVIVTPVGVAKVLDFGLSQESESETEQEGVIWATPFYVSPETLMRETEDARSDIYALGMMLRNLLTGEDQLPDKVEGITSLLAAKRKLPSMRVSYPNLDEGLCELVDHMTAFEPAGRPADYTEVLEEIAEVQARVGAVSLREMGREQRRRRKWLIAGAAAAVACGLAAAGPVAFVAAPVEVEQQHCEVPAVVQWPERQLWREADKALRNKQWLAAAETLARLAEQAQTPSHVRAAALQEQMLCLLADAEAEQMARAEKHVQELPKAPPAAAAKAPLTQAALLVMQAQEKVAAGEIQEVQRLLTAARPHLEAAGISDLPDLLDSHLRDVPRMVAGVGRTQVRRALRRGDFAAARRAFVLLHDAKLTDLERAELSIQTELCDAGEALYQALARKGKPLPSGASAAEVRGAASSLGLGATFTAESYALALMLQGNYAAAFEADPYRSKPDAAAPFAVLMRDWKQRLGR